MFKIVLLIATGMLTLSVASENPPGWNRFRGPNGSGIAHDAKPPVEIGPGTLSWKTAVPFGLSSPVLSNGRVFLTALENERLVTLSFDAATGRVLWRKAAPKVPLQRVHSYNSPASPTPCTDGERVYAYFGSYGVLCYDFEGEIVWQKPLRTAQNQYGMATSPILYGDLLILVLDDDANLQDSKLSRSRILAFNKTTGEPAWETPRPLHRGGWSTPAIWRHEGGEELVVLGSGRLRGYDPQTGVEKWFVNGFARETTAVPVFGNGLAYASSAMGGLADDKQDPEPLWSAMLYFDADGDARIATNEITERFTFPLRPELPPTHEGFGIPLPSDPVTRAKRQRDIFNGIDKNHDGFWTQEEFAANLGTRPFRPLLAAIRPGGQGDITDTHIAWELRRSIPEIPSPIYNDGRLYLVRDGGILTAVDAKEGSIIYNQRLGATGQYSASPVIANGHIYLLSNKGVVSVVKAGDQFELVNQHDLDDPGFVSPAIDQSTLYIRTKSALHAFRSANTAQANRDP